MRSPEHLARAAGTSVGHFPEPDLPWGGLGFTFDNDSQILARPCPTGPEPTRLGLALSLSLRPSPSPSRSLSLSPSLSPSLSLSLSPSLSPSLSLTLPLTRRGGPKA